MNASLRLSLKITLLTIAFLIVFFAIQHMKTKGISENTQRILGVHPDDREIKAKLLSSPIDVPLAPSQNSDTEKNNENSEDNNY